MSLKEGLSMKEVGAHVDYYNLKTEDGTWLGEVILTSTGVFASVTDWGNFSYAWRLGSETIQEFMLRIAPDYLATKMATGVAYSLGTSKKIDAACGRFAEKILPALQAAIKAAKA